MEMEMYYVGGYVRDKMMGRKSGDVDIVVCTDDYNKMKKHIKSLGFEVLVEEPKYFTLKAKSENLKINNKSTVIDFVLARVDGFYKNGRSPESVSIANNIVDDLSRRDFTINAIAKNYYNGEIIDPFNGKSDIENKIIKTVGDPNERFSEDSLRIIRALRFSITHDFNIEENTYKNIIDNVDRYCELLHSVSIERIRNELYKMFSISAKKTLNMLNKLPEKYIDTIFRNDKLWLKPTLEKRKFKC